MEGFKYWFHVDLVGPETWELNFYCDDEQMEYGYEGGYCFSVAKSPEDAKRRCEALWESFKGEAIRHVVAELEAEIATLQRRVRRYKDEIGDE